MHFQARIIAGAALCPTDPLGGIALANHDGGRLGVACWRSTVALGQAMAMSSSMCIRP
jgi:hypothetical protein